MRQVVLYAAFILLVAVPVALELRKVPARLRTLWAGIRGVVYVPLLWLVLFPTAIGAFWLAEFVPILQWGLFDANIVVAPLTTDAGGGGGAAGASTTPWRLAVFVPLAALAFLLFNYYEETALYRSSYRGVFAWACLHLAMGPPLAAVIPLFAVGVGFKWLYDHKGRPVAYAAHVASNCGILALIVVLLVLG